MNAAKTEESCNYAYIQPTFFKDEVDIVCFWNHGKRGKVRTGIITCNNMQSAEKELKKFQPKSGDESTYYYSVSLFPKNRYCIHSLPT